ncbi:terpene cyclase/mutase family protein [Verrucomicrobiaceae bacterium N1E253]|uniref:Terpene cyclase/mutase family protein n=1 Tax=Oceaniferula marina TaxID=2748318 RepID=A0A851GL56_9BACT|nr:prenyltransferase/squalene oxidase repeat-containing protein [Oceaniferula marina]NWK55470.1 terpene cyclase/mutase family protein [Oceaniferula marina]
MSLHATLSPETLQLLHEQKRNSTITSVIIAILSVLLLGIGLTLYFLPAIKNIPSDVVVHHSPNDPNPKDPPPTMQRLFSQRPPSSANQVVPSIVAMAQNTINLPVLETPADIVGLAAGTGGDGDGLGPGDGDGVFIPGDPDIPNIQRCSKDERMNLLKQYGGKPETEDVVVRSLRWLKQTQNSDGSWGDQHKAGMTGLALLAYLGHCETPDSEEFGDSCLQAIVYLLNIGSQNNGRLATNTRDKHWPYEHAIATYALAEAYSFSKRSNYTIPQHPEVLKLAGEWIITHQHGSGGWDYQYDISGKRGGDLSIAAWHIQALKACDATGLGFDGIKSTIKAALNYVSARQAANGGFGYTGTSPVGGAGHHSLTGAGLLAYQMWGKGSRSEVRKGARYILDKAELDYNGPECDLYAHYYHSQAMIQRGGDQWKQYNQRFSDQILLNQADDGSWKKPGGGSKPRAVAANYANDSKEGIHYRTCLCTLMLEVYYRYLPGTH